VGFLAPADIVLETVTLRDIHGGQAFPYAAAAAPRLPYLKDLREVVTYMCVNNEGPLAPTNDCLTSQVTPGGSFNEGFAFQISALVGSCVMSRHEIVQSRSALLANTPRAPLLVIKELVMAFFILEKPQKVMLIGNGCGEIPLVIVLEGRDQDAVSGTPLADLIVFCPSVPISESAIPLALENHHPEDPEWSRCQLNHEERSLFLRFVKALGGALEHSIEWGMDGLATRIYFPPLFPSRSLMMREAIRICELETELGISIGHTKDAQELVKSIQSLKDYGNRMMADGKFSDAEDAYVLAATKLETNHVDLDDKANQEFRKLGAQCYCNLALAQIKIGQNKNAVLSCSVAIVLQPRWAKPYFRRGCCNEMLGQRDLALKDFACASKRDPSNTEISEAVRRMKSEISR